jgi:DNA-binding transcriptional ArsR family regulator
MGPFAGVFRVHQARGVSEVVMATKKAAAAAEGKLSKSKSGKSAEERQNAKKWTPEVWASGWTGIPTVLLERQASLKLTPQELNVLLQLLKHWWVADQKPFPSRAALAESIGLTPQSVQRHLTKLSAAGYIESSRRKRPDGGYTSNEYTFNGLVAALKPLAKEAIEERKKRSEEDSERRRRKSPRK